MLWGKRKQNKVRKGYMEYTGVGSEACDLIWGGWQRSNPYRTSYNGKKDIKN